MIEVDVEQDSAQIGSLHLVVSIEEPIAIELRAWNAGDETRLLDFMTARRDRLGREILDALDDAFALLAARTARLSPSDVGRRAA